jgi:hypothetical protein
MSSAQDKTAGYEAGAGGVPGTGGAVNPAASGVSGDPGTGRETGYPQGSHRRDPQYQRGTEAEYGYGPSGAQAGFTVMAAVLMMLGGLWSFFEGLVAIVRQSFYTTLPNYTFQFNVHGWGWVHLALGVLLFAAGACVLLGQTWARALGIVLAVFSGIANFLFLPYYPVWAIIVMAIDVAIIWALASGLGRRQNA